ncbi:MAG: type II toxin-antitoxin system VapC family toxin [Roseibium sp.]|nr:type II toxin-antitoxin system VapC family toxin [Roseibium sp.]
MSCCFLADTHVLLWALHNDARLEKHHAELVGNTENTIFASFASIWEIAIKVSRGKLSTVSNVPAALEVSGFTLLPIALEHIDVVRGLPDIHRDPFDRMLIAQARMEGFKILTVDPAFRAYDVEVL